MTQVHGAPPNGSASSAQEAPRTLYEVLQVSPRADDVVLRAAYRALARELHPDLNPSAIAAERMRELNAAYDVLNEPRQRTLYDLQLHQNHDPNDDGDSSEQGVRRRTSCWRCKKPLAGAYHRYCGECHWITCHTCRACGCDHPAWRARRARQVDRLRLLAIAGWVAAMLLAFGWLGSLALVLGLGRF